MFSNTPPTLTQLSHLTDVPDPDPGFFLILYFLIMIKIKYYFQR